MEYIIFWGVPAFGALLGLSFRLYNTWLAFCVVLLSVYVGIWSRSLVGNVLTFLPREAEAYRAVIAVAAGSVVAALILAKVAMSLNTRNTEFPFPALADKLGGLLCGFLLGVVGVNFLLFLFCMSPARQLAEDKLDIAAIEKHATGELGDWSGLIDRLTFVKSTRAERDGELRQMLYAPPEAPGAPPPAAAPETVTPAAEAPATAPAAPESDGLLPKNIEAEDAAPVNRPPRAKRPPGTGTYQERVVTEHIPGTYVDKNGRVVHLTEEQRKALGD